MRRPLPPLLGLSLCCVALLALCAPAGAATTRAEYTSAVNAICVDYNAKAQAISERSGSVRPPKGKDKKGPDLKALNRLFAKLLKLDVLEIDQVAAVGPAPGDEAAVAEFVTRLRATHDLSKVYFAQTLRFVRLLGRLESLSAGDKPSRKQRRFVKKFIRAANQLDKLTTKLLDESSRLKTVASQLGVSICVPDAES